jgi:hypothetical protein
MSLNLSSRVILSVAVTLFSSWAVVVVAQTTPAVDKTVAAISLNPRSSDPDVKSEKPKRVDSVKDEDAEPAADVSANTVTTKTTSPQTPDEDKWQLGFTPYLWIAGINGTAGIANRTVEVDSGITASNVHLNFGFMSTFEARKNKFVLLTDLQYSNLGTERPTPGPLFSSATAEFKTFILDPEVGYRIAGNPERGNSIDILGGIRYWHLKSELHFTAGVLPSLDLNASRNWVDAVGGVRAKIHLSPKVFLTGKVDLGGGGSKFTYQLLGGGGYQINKNFALVGGYRALHVDYDKDNFLFDMTLAGPIMGVGIKF